MADKAKSHSLTIYLAKAECDDPRKVIENPASLAQISFESTLGPGAMLYIPVASTKPPKWTSFFQGYVPAGTFGLNRSEGALLTLKHKDRVYAMTFGTGRFQLKQDCWEERFGLRVALNCIGTNVVKSIDKHTLDQLARHTREQASREATASEFGLDVEQDLLRAVIGTPTDPYFGKWVSGTDTLHLALPVTIADLPELLERLDEKYLDTSYQTNFPWVDQIAEIRDSVLLGALNGELVQRLRNGQKDQTWMAIPEVMSWDNVGGFRFPGSKGPRVEYHDIHLEHFLETVDVSAISEDLLHARVVECVDADGAALKRWKVQKCLYCELDHNGASYLLSGGCWYRVRSDFVSQINAAVAAIPDYDGVLPEYDDDSEEDYLKRWAKSDTTLALMDQKNIMHGGGASKIEFCDVITGLKDLLHIKRYAQSAVLSHLFAQGLTSGELFQTDPDFRRKLNDKLPVAHQMVDTAKRPTQGEYRVVFAIVSDRPGPLNLPFFSKLNLKHAVRRLEGYGFRIAKAKIVVSIQRAKLQRIRPRKRAA